MKCVTFRATITGIKTAMLLIVEVSNLLQGQNVRDELVDLDLATQIVVNEIEHADTALPDGSSK